MNSKVFCHKNFAHFQKINDVSPLIKYFNRPFLGERFDPFSTLKNNLENQNFETFKKVVHNFGKSEDDETH